MVENHASSKTFLAKILSCLSFINYAVINIFFASLVAFFQEIQLSPFPVPLYTLFPSFYLFSRSRMHTRKERPSICFSKDVDRAWKIEYNHTLFSTLW